jgi:hypothetical protein
MASLSLTEKRHAKRLNERLERRQKRREYFEMIARAREFAKQEVRNGNLTQQQYIDAMRSILEQSPMGSDSDTSSSSDSDSNDFRQRSERKNQELRQKKGEARQDYEQEHLDYLDLLKRFSEIPKLNDHSPAKNDVNMNDQSRVHSGSKRKSTSYRSTSATAWLPYVKSYLKLHGYTSTLRHVNYKLRTVKSAKEEKEWRNVKEWLKTQK